MLLLKVVGIEGHFFACLLPLFLRLTLLLSPCIALVHEFHISYNAIHNEAWFFFHEMIWSLLLKKMIRL